MRPKNLSNNFVSIAAVLQYTLMKIEDLNIFETAVRYQMYHALGILIFGVMGYFIPHETLIIPAWFLIAGVIIFSGSLYIEREDFKQEAYKFQ